MAERYDEELFLGYLEDDLTQEQRDRFERELTADPRLFSLVNQMRKDRAALRDLEPQRAPPELMEPVNQRLEREMLLGKVASPEMGSIRTRRFTLGRVTAISALAAMVLVCASIAAMIYYNTTSLWRTEESLRTMAFDSTERHDDGIGAPADRLTLRGSDEADEATSPTAAATAMAAHEPPAPTMADSAAPTAGADAALSEGDAAGPRSPEVADGSPPIGLLAQSPAVEVRDSALKTAERAEEKVAVLMNEARATVSAPPVIDAFPDSSATLSRDEVKADDPAVELAGASIAEAESPVEFQIDVVTDNPDADMAALLVFTAANDIRVSSPQIPRRTDKALDIAEQNAVGKVKRAAESVTAPPVQQAVLEDLQVEQLSHLLAHLNRRDGRRAPTAGQVTTSSPGPDKPQPKSATVPRARMAIGRSRRATTGRLEGARDAGATFAARSDWGVLINEQLPLAPAFAVFQPGTRLRVRIVYTKTPIEAYTDAAKDEPESGTQELRKRTDDGATADP